MPLVNALPKSSKAPLVNAASPASFKGCAFFFSPGSAAVGTARGFVTARRSRRRGWHLLFSRERLNLGQEYMYLFKFLGGLIESSLDSALWSLPRSVPAAGGTDPAPAAGPFLQSPLPGNPPELGARCSGCAHRAWGAREGPARPLAARLLAASCRLCTCSKSRIRPLGGLGRALQLCFRARFAPEPRFGRLPLPSPCLHLEARHRNPDSIILKPE